MRMRRCAATPRSESRRRSCRQVVGGRGGRRGVVSVHACVPRHETTNASTNTSTVRFAQSNTAALRDGGRLGARRTVHERDRRPSGHSSGGGGRFRRASTRSSAYSAEADDNYYSGEDEPRSVGDQVDDSVYSAHEFEHDGGENAYAADHEDGSEMSLLDGLDVVILGGRELDALANTMQRKKR